MRLTKNDLKRLNISEGQSVVLEIHAREAPIDISNIPVFDDDEPAEFRSVKQAYYRELPEKW